MILISIWRTSGRLLYNTFFRIFTIFWMCVAGMLRPKFYCLTFIICDVFGDRSHKAYCRNESQLAWCAFLPSTLSSIRPCYGYCACTRSIALRSSISWWGVRSSIWEWILWIFETILHTNCPREWRRWWILLDDVTRQITSKKFHLDVLRQRCRAPFVWKWHILNFVKHHKTSRHFSVHVILMINYILLIWTLPEIFSDVSRAVRTANVKS